VDTFELLLKLIKVPTKLPWRKMGKILFLSENFLSVFFVVQRMEKTSLIFEDFMAF
jgi:hypothetical protein